MDFFWRWLGYPKLFERFTDRIRKVMVLANQISLAGGRDEIETADLLLGLLREGSGVGVYLLKQIGVDIQKLELELCGGVAEAEIDAAIGRKLPLATETKAVISRLIEESRTAKDDHAGTEHLVLALAVVESKARDLMERAGAREELIRAAERKWRDQASSQSPEGHLAS
jgi:ATP-dependent Clp protease ATP-binding subunit ClpA